MSKTLDEIRKKLQAMDNRKGSQQGGFTADKTTYPHWNIAEGTSTTISRSWRVVPTCSARNGSPNSKNCTAMCPPCRWPTCVRSCAKTWVTSPKRCLPASTPSPWPPPRSRRCTVRSSKTVPK